MCQWVAGGRAGFVIVATGDNREGPVDYGDNTGEGSVERSIH